MNPAEWSRWVSRESPNARIVWHSQLPSIVLKSIWHVLPTNDLAANVRSQLCGMGFHRYPKRWWRQALFKARRVDDLLWYAILET